MLKEILKFNGDAKQMLQNESLDDFTIGDYVEKLGAWRLFLKIFWFP